MKHICSACGKECSSVRGLLYHRNRFCKKVDTTIDGDGNFDALGEDDALGIKRRRIDRRLRNEPIELDFNFDSQDPFSATCHTHNAPNEDQNVSGFSIPSQASARQLPVQREPESFNYGVFDDGRHSMELDDATVDDTEDVHADASHQECDDDYTDIDTDDDSEGCVEFPASAAFDLDFHTDSEIDMNSNDNEENLALDDINPPQKETSLYEPTPPLFPQHSFQAGKRHEDKYHPDNFDETKLQYYPPPKEEMKNLPLELSAQLDLHLILTKAGAPLYLFNSIFEWIKLYTMEKSNLFQDAQWLTREQLISRMAEEHGTKDRKPTLQTLSFRDNERLLTVPKFSFLKEVMSLLHDPHLMKDENFVPGYDITTGKSHDGADFWKHNTIRPDDLHSYPTPTDGKKEIHHMYCGTKFEMSRKRYCKSDHHMPVPLVLFYDEANADFWGGLKSAPVMMTLGFFNNPCKARIEFWRVLAIVPNLSLGKGKSDTTDPEIKAQEHHLVLRSVFEELERISNEGGIKTTINGKNVVLKFWIHSIIGDTKGHNEMCGHNNSSRSDVATRLCLCSRKLNQLSTLPLECVAITTSLIDSHSEAGTLDEIGQKNIDNVFDHLPMGHPTRGVHACTAFDDLHVWGNGLHPYIIEAFAHLLFTTQKKRTRTKERKVAVAG